MQECRFCKETIKDNEGFCHYCGYDPATDTIRQDFVPSPQALKSRTKKRRAEAGPAVGSGVKKFAFIGLAIVVFSVFSKNHFNPAYVAAEVKQFFVLLSKGKFTLWKQKPGSKIQWVDMRDFRETGR